MPLAGTYVLFLTMLVVTERPGRKSRTVRGSGSGGLPPAAGDPTIEPVQSAGLEPGHGA